MHGLVNTTFQSQLLVYTHTRFWVEISWLLIQYAGIQHPKSCSTNHAENNSINLFPPFFVSYSIQATGLCVLLLSRSFHCIVLNKSIKIFFIVKTFVEGT